MRVASEGGVIVVGVALVAEAGVRAGMVAGVAIRVSARVDGTDRLTARTPFDAFVTASIASRLSSLLFFWRREGRLALPPPIVNTIGTRNSS